MNVLSITGDKKFVPGNPRYDLQASQVALTVLYWGRGALVPHVPAGHYDVVSAQDPFWRGFVARLVARRIGAKFNVQVHTDLRAQSFVKRVVARSVLHHADSIRVVSEPLKRQVEALGARAPIVVLPVYQDLSTFEHLAHVSHPRFTKAILWIGRFEPEKDPLKALAVLADVRHAGVDAGLVMLGAGSLEHTLKERAQAMDLASWVEFPGWQAPATYLAQADVVVSTSQYEGYGASMVEALAAGVAVVAPDVGVAREAGAVVVERKMLAQATIEALRTGTRGTLNLPILSREAWAQAWKASL